MIIESKKLFFNTVNIILEDNKIDELIKSHKYSKISAVSYKKMDLTGFDVWTKTTALILLNKDKDEIFSKFRDTTRNEVRRTYKNDDLKFITDDKNFDESYSLYKEFEYIQGRVPVSKKELKHCKLFSANYKGKMVSAVYVTISFPYLRIRSIFSKRFEVDDKDLRKVISNATRRIMWEICLWGKENNFKSLDFASVNFKNPKTANITKFKMSFGGQVVNEYIYTYKSKLFKNFERFVFIKIWISRLINFIKSILKGRD